MCSEFREYEEKVRKLNEEDAEKKEEKKRKDLEAIQKKKDDALKSLFTFG